MRGSARGRLFSSRSRPTFELVRLWFSVTYCITFLFQPTPAHAPATSVSAPHFQSRPPAPPAGSLLCVALRSAPASETPGCPFFRTPATATRVPDPQSSHEPASPSPP